MKVLGVNIADRLRRFKPKVTEENTVHKGIVRQVGDADFVSPVASDHHSAAA